MNYLCKSKYISVLSSVRLRQEIRFYVSCPTLTRDEPFKGQFLILSALQLRRIKETLPLNLPIYLLIAKSFHIRENRPTYKIKKSWYKNKSYSSKSCFPNNTSRILTFYKSSSILVLEVKNIGTEQNVLF